MFVLSRDKAVPLTHKKQNKTKNPGELNRADYILELYYWLTADFTAAMLVGKSKSFSSLLGTKLFFPTNSGSFFSLHNFHIAHDQERMPRYSLFVPTKICMSVKCVQFLLGRLQYPGKAENSG